MEALLKELTELEQAQSGDWLWVSRAREVAQRMALLAGEVLHSEFQWLRSASDPIVRGFTEAAKAMETQARIQHKFLASNLDYAQLANQTIGDPEFVPVGPLGWIYLAHHREKELQETIFLPPPLDAA